MEHPREQFRGKVKRLSELTDADRVSMSQDELDFIIAQTIYEDANPLNEG